ncbi:hypothetical protein LINGRAHAP2_LOCUS2946, partial [Linum grandiflorum]
MDLGFQGRKCQFRFDARWISNSDWDREDDCATTVTNCQKELSAWARKQYAEKRGREESIKARLGELQNAARSPIIEEEEKVLKQEIEDMWKSQELEWSQKAKINWLKVGDRNTAFFHYAAVYRRQRNRISRLQDDNDVWIPEEDTLCTMARDYFVKIFSQRVEPDSP